MADQSTAARPYAKAIFETARDSGRYDEWSERLAFWSALVTNPEMSQRLDVPGLTADDRADLLERVIGDAQDDESRNIIRLLAENDRLAIIPDIQHIFDGLRSEAEGEIEATVTTAFDLADEQQARIADALGKRLNRKVRVVVEIDKDLIGGAVIQAGDLVIDGSLKGRVEKLGRAVTN